MNVLLDKNSYTAGRNQEDLPPMLQQYVEYKLERPDTLLLIQVGDFYEAFFEDANTLARVLNITLTSRDKNSENPIPMAGVPIAVVDSYITRLTAQGYSVALVSQDSKPQNGKGMVQRSIDRIFIPGINILSESETGECGRPIVSVLPIALSKKSFTCALAILYLESGQVLVDQVESFTELIDKLQRLQAVELIIPNSWEGQKLDYRQSWIRDLSHVISGLVIKFRSDGIVGVSRDFLRIDGFSQLSPEYKRVVRLILLYVDETTIDIELPVNSIRTLDSNQSLNIDLMTRKNLELIVNNATPIKDGSLFGVLDHTVTPRGGSLLRQLLLNPFYNKEVIEDRLAITGKMFANYRITEALRELLGKTCDVLRIASRIELNVVTPGELLKLRGTLVLIPEIVECLRSFEIENEISTELFNNLDIAGDLSNILLNALCEPRSENYNANDIFKDEYNADLARFRNQSRNGFQLIFDLEGRYKDSTKVSSLKIRHNNVLGYFVEVTKANLDKLSDVFVKKQSTVNGARFFTEELKKLEEDLSYAESHARDLEKQMFKDLLLEINRYVPRLKSVASALGSLDVFCSLVYHAVRFDWSKPEIYEDTRLKIKKGRHPIVETLLKSEFVPNSLELTPDGVSTVVVTGPNMGGKSTYLRQAALIVILAQIGSYVPAEAAEIGLVDKVFARIGASDNLLEGESTFMVEMRETSSILRNATRKSLILIDEIGRGTATQDGLAIARAILEYIVQNKKSRSLFATHFHELSELSVVLNNLGNCSVGVLEADGELVFTHEINSGAADRSYGLEVAKLAGLPEDLLIRAKELFDLHETDAVKTTKQIDLFQVPSPKIASDTRNEEYEKLKSRLSAINCNKLTPIEALCLLSELVDSIE